MQDEKVSVDAPVCDARTERMQRTRTSLVSEARKLTAAHGLAGFTIEELCEVVGVSRRTFFNYFASKDDAVVGDSPDFLPEAKRAEFVAQGGGSDGELSPTLLADIVGLVTEYGRAHPVSRAEHLVLREVVGTAPQLLPRFIALNKTQELKLATAIAEREGLTDDDPRARLFVSVILGIAMRTVDDYFAEANTTNFDELMERNVAFASQLFAQYFDQTGRP